METPSPAPAAKSCGLATWSVVLGALGLVTCGLAAIAGVICGAIGLSRINNSGGRLQGRGVAIAGIVISGFCMLLGLVVIPISAGLILPVLARARESARRAACASNLSQIAIGCQMFADANDGRLPNRLAELYPKYIPDPRVFSCPSHGKHMPAEAQIGAQSDYVLIPGLKLDSPATCILAFDRHGHAGEIVNVVYVTGVVELISQSELETLLGTQSNAPPDAGF